MLIMMIVILRRSFISGSGLYDCTSCHDFFTLDGGMCIECPSGQYYNVSSQACELCNDSCLTCSSGGENGCTSCEAPKSLHPSTSTCRKCCPAGVLEEDYDSSCCSCDPATGEHHFITGLSVSVILSSLFALLSLQLLYLYLIFITIINLCLYIFFL